MTFSMTGFGKSAAQYEGRSITIEIRTLNSKQGDLYLRIPPIYREKEIELRDRVSNSLGRGKIEVNIQRESAEGELSSELNEKMVENYYQLIKKLEAKMGERSGATTVDYLSLIMKMPDVMKPVSETLSQEEHTSVLAALDECIGKVNEFRAQEGQKLESVLGESARAISEYLVEVEPYEKERIEAIKARIHHSFKEHGSEDGSHDKDRFEQELIYYLEKLDITEEKVRLKAHCEYFFTTLNEDGAKGKKLSFIAQEMGREINTLGSKAQHSEIQKIVVGMKEELEKIKEQVLNVL